jgi:hypothetical protein
VPRRTTIRTTIGATQSDTRGTQAGRYQSQQAETERTCTCLAGKGSGGFESPMLHQDPNSELARDDVERQVFGFWTTIFGLWTTIVTTCLGPLATAGITTACPTAPCDVRRRLSCPPDELLRDLHVRPFSPCTTARRVGRARLLHRGVERSRPARPTPDTPVGRTETKERRQIATRGMPGVNTPRRSATALENASPDRYRQP